MWNRLHLLAYFLFVAMVSVEEVMTNSGYSVVWSLFSGATRRVDQHFECGGKGNWSTWGIMDWLHGTLVGGVDVGENLKRLEKLVEEKDRELKKRRRRVKREKHGEDEDE